MVYQKYAHQLLKAIKHFSVVKCSQQEEVNYKYRKIFVLNIVGEE